MSQETTERLPLASESGLLEDACLVLIYGAPDLGRRFALTDDVSIGRDESAGIVVDAGSVSRQHAHLEFRDGAWHVLDLGSTNGTRHNGEIVHGSAALSNGDLVKVGGVIFKYIAGGNVESLFHEAIYHLTIFDGLTRLHNKRYLLEFLDREIARALRYGSALTLVMIDIDHFKRVNDRFGHPAGDRVLERTATLLSAAVRREQLLARYGGEEFALVLPELERNQVRSLCEHLRSAVEGDRVDLDGAPTNVTISAGGASFETPMSRTDLIVAADAQLYRAKRNGRNRVVLAGDTVALDDDL